MALPDSATSSAVEIRARRDFSSRLSGSRGLVIVLPIWPSPSHAESPHSLPIELPGTLVISPHPDDAALSVGAVLSLALMPRPFVIVTVFSDSEAHATSPLGVSKLTNIRSREDQRYAALVGAALVTLGHADALARHSCDSWETLASGDDDVAFVRDLTNELQCLVNELDLDILLGPAAIGPHIDHRTARRATEGVVANRTLVYADQPYALVARDQSWTVHPGLVLVVDAASRGAVQAKQAAAKMYPSQPAARFYSEALDRVEPPSVIEALYDARHAPTPSKGPREFMALRTVRS